MNQASGEQPDGVLHTPHGGRWRLRRWNPPDDLAPFVGCAWSTEWDLPAGRTHVQAALPHPAANVVLEDGALRVYGPSRDRFDRTLAGSGRVLGIRFRPGVTGHLLGTPAHTTVDTVLPPGALGPLAAAQATDAAQRLDAHADVATAVPVLFELVAAWCRPPDDVALDLRDAAELVEIDAGIRTTDELAARLHRSRRTLQRQFAEHVGLSPAWVLRRYRMLRTLAGSRGDDTDWAAIAQRVGYYDQSHLIRDFTATIGRSPERYKRH